MLFAIVDKQSLSVKHQYDATEALTTSHYWDCSWAEPLCTHLPVPAELDATCMKAELIDDVITLVADPVKLAAKAAVAKQALVTAAYDRMNADVMAEMELVYGTAKSESATAYQLTWEKMAANPQLFAGEAAGLGFATVEDVVDFAMPKLAAADAYAVNRLKRIAQFQAEKAAILG
jgi:hypothetical protein